MSPYLVTVDLLSEAYRVNKVDLHRLKIRRAVIQITGSSIGVSAYERPRSRWWNPFTWSRRHRPPPAQPIEIDMYRHQRSRPPESYYSPFGAGTSAAAVRRRWWQLWRDRLARDPRTATASAALQAGTSSRYVLWTLDPTEIEQAGDRAVWVSPNIEPLIRRCFRRKDASCLLDMRAFGDGGAFLRNGFEGGVRIGARLVVEYQR